MTNHHGNISVTTPNLQVRSNYKPTKKKSGGKPALKCVPERDYRNVRNGYQVIEYCDTHGDKCKKMPATAWIVYDDPDMGKKSIPVLRLV